MTTLFSETEEYHFISVLSCGTFGQVATYKRQSDLTTVAVKRLDLSRANMFRRETRLLAALSSENLKGCHIVHFFEAFRDQMHNHMVFEVLDKNLYQMQMEIDFRPLAIRDIRTITFQVLTALAKLNEIGIVHADIKPENIMLVNQHLHPFRLKLIDFGSSYTIDETDSLRVPYLQSRFYRAPEILLGLPFCETMDMWSLGCVIAELYLGYPLYQAKSELELAHYICDSHGMTPASLLNLARKTKLFFDLVKDHTGKYQWKLKPARVRPSTSGLWRHAVIHFDQVEKGAPVPGFEGEDSAEIADRQCMEDLLKCMLTLDMQQRISTSQALCHPFISLQHLHVSDSYHQYRKFSVQGYKEALIPYQPSMDGQHSPSQLSVLDHTQELPKKEKGPIRNLLRSFFTHLCLHLCKKQPVGPRSPSDPMEGPHTQSDLQDRDDSLEGSGNTEISKALADKMAGTEQTACDKLEK